METSLKKIHKWPINNGKMCKSLVMREIQIKTTVIYRFTSTRMPGIKRQIIVC